MKRIRKVVWVIRAMIALAIIVIGLVISIFLAGAIGWMKITPRVASIPYLSAYSSFAAIPLSALTLEFARVGLLLAGILVLNKLLWSFAGGNFFFRQNIRRIQWLGLLVICDWPLVKLLDAVCSRIVSIGFDDFAKLGMGLLVILIAWIMDEGRKIQEEQELTV